MATSDTDGTGRPSVTETERSIMNHKPTPVLILGGWSPGPLDHLKHSLQRQCVFHEPSIPMPPMGCSWCCDWSMLALAGVLVLMSWSCHALKAIVKNRGLLVLVRLGIVMASLVLLRLCVAAVVRNSVSRGVTIAQRLIQSHNVAIVLAFSWGGGVAAEMLRRGLLGGPNQPVALLIAPTTSLMYSIALQRDPALVIRIEDSSRVHVFHGNHDEVFCPHSDRWTNTGVTLNWCNDNHVFTTRASSRKLSESLVDLIQQRKLVIYEV